MPHEQAEKHNLFRLINVQCEYSSIILMTNKDFTRWEEFLIDDNVAEHIVDRLFHHSHIFMTSGESYRLRQKLAN